MLKRFAQILALVTPMLFVACNSTDTTTASTGTASTGFSGTYTGTVTGLNAGPVTIIVSSSNVVSGGFSITNRQVDCAPRGGICETTVTGTVDAAGNIKGDFVDSGIATMHFNGKIVGDTITEGTWGEYIHDPVPDGAFTASRQLVLAVQRQQLLRLKLAHAKALMSAALMHQRMKFVLHNVTASSQSKVIH